MAESKLVQLNFENNGYSCVQYNVFSMLSLGRILISDLVVANLFMHSLQGITEGCFCYTQSSCAWCKVSRLYVHT